MLYFPFPFPSSSQGFFFKVCGNLPPKKKKKKKKKKKTHTRIYPSSRQMVD